MASPLYTWQGNQTGGSSSYQFKVEAKLYKDGDTGSGWKMHWVWDILAVTWGTVGRDFSRNYGGSTGTTHIYYQSGGYTNYVFGSVTGAQQTIPYGSTISTSASASYKTDSGTTYTSSVSSSTARYTVPKPTYAITYDANGGSGAPSSQTKTYGTNIALRSTVPTKTDHDFVGWSTTSSSTTAQYQPGDTYTANAALKLYAVWQRNYNPPTINLRTVDRCDSNGDYTDEGDYCKAVIEFAADTTYDPTNLISQVDLLVDGVTTRVSSVGRQSGTALVVSSNQLQLLQAYQVTATVTDTYKGRSVSDTKTLAVPSYVLDFSPGAREIGVCHPATIEDSMAFGIKQALDGVGIGIIDPEFPLSTPTDSYWSTSDGKCIVFFDGGGFDDENKIGYIQQFYQNNGRRGIQLCARRVVGGSSVYSRMNPSVDENGNAHLMSDTIGVKRSANAGKTIGTGGIESYADGPSVSLEPGVWAINGQVNFSTGSSSGSRNIAARFKVGSSQYSEQQRLVSAANNWAALNVTLLIDLSANAGNTTVTLQGSSSMSYTTSATWYINAYRIGG